MRIIIASTTVPHGTSGGRLIVQWTADALRGAGHQVEEFYLPFPTAASATLPALVGLRRMPFRSSCDRLITIRWPAHVLVHDNKAAWFIHHYREAFDLWDTPFRAVPDDAEGRSFRELLRHVDTSTLGECRDLFANSLIVRDRLRTYNGLEVEPLFPPIGGDTSRFRCEGYGDFIFYPSRITPIKRQELAVQAMEKVAERLLRFHVDAGRRLVEHEEARTGRERLGDERALLLPAGEGREPPPRKVAQTDALERLVDGDSVVSAQPSPRVERRTPRLDDLADRRRRVNAHLRPLGEVPDTRAVVERARRSAEQQDLSARRPLEAERKAEQRRLAASVRPCDRNELALVDPQVHVSEHGRSLRVGEVDVLELDRYRHPSSVRSACRFWRMSVK